MTTTRYSSEPLSAAAVNLTIQMHSQIAYRGRIDRDTTALTIILIEMGEFSFADLDALRLATIDSGREGLRIRLAIRKFTALFERALS